MEQQIEQGIQNFLLTCYFCVYPSLSFGVFWGVCVCVWCMSMCVRVFIPVCMCTELREEHLLACRSPPDSSEARFSLNLELGSYPARSSHPPVSSQHPQILVVNVPEY